MRRRGDEKRGTVGCPSFHPALLSPSGPPGSLIISQSRVQENRIHLNYISSLVTDQVMNILFPKKDSADLLSKREIEVLTFVAEGKSSRQIAQILSLSQTTVHNHRMRIKKKLGVSKTSDLLKYAIQKGYASIEV